MRRPASCHPDRPHYAKGMCFNCYRRDRYTNNPEWRKRVVSKSKKYATKNRDQVRNRARNYYSQNRDNRILKVKRYRGENREAILRSSKERYRKNRDRIRAVQKQYYAKNRETIAAKNKRRYLNNRDRILHQRRLKLYGLSRAEYDALLIKQEGVCAICRRSDNGKALAIDHSHPEKTIRGLLCQNCNRGIGLLGDSVEVIESAFNYLKQIESTQKEKITYGQFRLGSFGV